MADSVTVLQDVGTSGKKTLAILGDGFAAGADQTIYNNYVRDVVMKQVFGAASYYNEDAAAWNIHRVNLESKHSGASTRTWDLKGTPDDASDDTVATEHIYDTALGLISNGQWKHNWFEDGANTKTLIENAIKKWAPGAHLTLIIVKSTLPGGLRTPDNILRVTTQEGWATVAHECGHGFGDLADEYSAHGAYKGSEPKRVNITIETKRANSNGTTSSIPRRRYRPASARPRIGPRGPSPPAGTTPPTPDCSRAATNSRPGSTVRRSIAG